MVKLRRYSRALLILMQGLGGGDSLGPVLSDTIRPNIKRFCDHVQANCYDGHLAHR